MNDIHTNICSLRKSNDMTLEELGKRIGTTKQNIRRYENGEIKNIPYDKIIAISNVFGVSPMELMGWKNDKQFKIEIPLNIEQGMKDAELTTKFHKLSAKNQDIIMSMMNSLLEGTN